MTEFRKTIIISGIISLVVALGVSGSFYFMVEKSADERFENEREIDLSNYITQQRYEEIISEKQDDLETDISLNEDGLQLINSTLEIQRDIISFSESYTMEKHDKNGTLVESREG